MIKRILKKLLSLIVIISNLFIMTSCWDYKDVNKRSLELAIGVDGKEDTVMFSGEIANLTPNSLNNKEQAKITSVYKYHSVGEFFEGSRSSFDAQVLFPDFSAAARVVIFGKKYAETIGIESYINRLSYTESFRTSALVGICRESPDDFFKYKSKNHIGVGYATEDTINYLYNEGGTIYKSVQQVLSDINFKHSGYLLPYLTNNDGIVEYLGLAVIKNGKLIDIIKREESDGFLFLLSKKASLTYVTKVPNDPKNLASIKCSLKKEKIKTSILDNKIHISIDLSVSSQLKYLYRTESLTDYALKEIENDTSHKIKEGILSAINKSQKNFKCDVFEFGKYFKSDHIETFEKIDWENEYENIIFHVNIKNTITNTTLLDTNTKNFQGR